MMLTNRPKHINILDGSNIYPCEVEEVVLVHPVISEVPVIGQLDVELGKVERRLWCQRRANW